MVDFTMVENLITSKLQGATVQITDLTGGRDHLGIFVASNEFEGKILIDRHQMIMDILSDKLKSGEIHAVQLKTLTIEKAKEKGLL